MAEMASSPVILGFDTSGPHCAAALHWGAGSVATRFEEMAKGQAERLIPLVEELLADQGYGWPDLDALAVGIGPGNFTGIRISVSAARGLALALKIPVIPVSNFEIMRGPGSVTDLAPQQVRLNAPRGANYVQTFENGRPVSDAELVSDSPVEVPPFGDSPLTLIRVAAAKWAAGMVDDTRPAPLYVKPPDAAPPRDLPPTIVA
jgi:tRNA threonylcarbamoyl adenosine modification protein YeaZ